MYNIQVRVVPNEVNEIQFAITAVASFQVFAYLTIKRHYTEMICILYMK